MGQHKSIGERLKRAKSIEAKREVAAAWAKNWKEEQERLVYELAIAINAGDWEQCRYLHRQIKAVTEKRFGAIGKVFDALSARLPEE